MYSFSLNYSNCYAAPSLTLLKCCEMPDQVNIEITINSKMHLYSSEQNKFLFDVESLVKKFYLHLLNICIEIHRVGILIVFYVAVYGVSTRVLVDFVFFWVFFFKSQD